MAAGNAGEETGRFFLYEPLQYVQKTVCKRVHVPVVGNQTFLHLLVGFGPGILGVIVCCHADACWLSNLPLGRLGGWSPVGRFQHLQIDQDHERPTAASDGYRALLDEQISPLNRGKMHAGTTLL